jgi:hypothetical protein
MTSSLLAWFPADMPGPLPGLPATGTCSLPTSISSLRPEPPLAPAKQQALVRHMDQLIYSHMLKVRASGSVLMMRHAPTSSSAARLASC